MWALFWGVCACVYNMKHLADINTHKTISACMGFFYWWPINVPPIAYSCVCILYLVALNPKVNMIDEERWIGQSTWGKI